MSTSTSTSTSMAMTTGTSTTKGIRLELINVSFSYGRRKALRRITLKLPSSGIVCFVGPNGSGKSTLLKCINMILKPHGEILFNQKKVHELPISEIARIFGYVPQDFTSTFPATVFDMILLGRRPYLGWSPSENDLDIVSKNISRMGLDEFALRNINELSGGERQKVLIARALSQEPMVLLLDEPTSNLDIKHQLEVMKNIKGIVESKKILALLAIHDLNLASQYSNKIIMLSKGTVFAQGKPQEVLTKNNIRSVYNVNVAIHKHGEVQHIVPIEGDDSLYLEEIEDDHKG